MGLTVTEIRNAKPQAARTKLTDSGGLVLEVSPKGVKTWKLQFRHRGKQRTLSLGRWPDHSLAEAREWREAIKAKLRQGQDPIADVRAAKREQVIGAVTFEEIAREFLDKQAGVLDARYHAWVVARFDNDVFPEIGANPLADFSHADVLRLIRRFEKRDAIEIGRKTLGYVSKVMQYGIAKGLLVQNPVPNALPAMKPKPKVQHFAKLPAARLPEFFERLSRSGADPVTLLAIRWTMLTMVRTNETRFARPEEIEGLSAGNPIWRIPADRMKMSREHIVPLPKQAVALLDAIEAVRVASGSPWMFPQTTNAKKAISENRMLYCLYDLGYKGVATMHGFRGLASTVLNEQVDKRGTRLFDRDWIELQLAHDESSDVRAAYNAAEYLGPRRRMLQWWANYLVDQEAIGKLL
jgi:integrase